MTYYYLDIETTGFDVENDKIITIQYVELDEKTKSILLSELGQEEPIVIDANFGQRVGQVMELIVASREFQLS